MTCCIVGLVLAVVNLMVVGVLLYLNPAWRRKG